MEGIEYLYELCEVLPRCGPGDNEFTRRAFNSIQALPKQPLILDIGCGPGVQAIELAKISNGNIIALDNHRAFLDKLMETAAKEGLTENITPKNISMLEMDFEEKSFDLIWSEGALYIMGFQNGLKECHRLLKNNGYLAVTELVYIAPDPPAPVLQYFANEYPDIKSVKGNIEVIQKEGFNLISNFTLPESAWFNSYYIPIERELPRLNEKYTGNEIALGVYKAFQNEIDFYKKYSEFYGYEFFIMQKDQMPPKFLIINDEDGTRTVLTDILEEKFPEAFIKTARNNQEAFRVIENFYPDIVITDFYHPGGASGLAFLRRFKNDSRWKSIPVICFTPDDFFRMKDEEKKEFDAFCKTSITIDEFINCINRFL